jgi:integrase
MLSWLFVALRISSQFTGFYDPILTQTLTHMVSIIPYYKKERGSVIIRLIHKGEVAKVVQTGVKVLPDQWKDGKVTAHPNKALLNQKIQNKVNELQAVLTKAELLGVPITKDRIKNLAEGGEVTTDFYKHCTQWIKDKYTNKGTRAAMLSDLEKVHLFAPSLQFGDIDKRWLTKYEGYLRHTLKHEANTVWRSMKFIRTMLYDAQSVLGKQINNPFQSREYKMPLYRDPNKDGLTLEEVDRLEKLLKKPIPETNKIVIAKFLFMCYTGLRISDAKRFTQDHLIDGRVVMTSQKTGITTRLKIHTRLAKVLSVLKELPERKFADQNFNEWLKVIAEMAEIDRISLTTHIGRHTFGCLLAEMQVNEEEAMELMGVTNKNVVRVYYKLRQPRIDKAADRLNEM